VNVVC